MGSKAKYAADILNVILLDLLDKYSITTDQLQHYSWIKPFVGGANMMAAVPSIFFKNRIGYDINYFVIKMFQALQNGWVPPDNISEEEYDNAKHWSKEYYTTSIPISLALIGFVGIGCSYSGKWFGGYARGKNNYGLDRNYCLESKKNILRQKPKLINVDFIYDSYNNIKFPLKSIIYCDPPYASTTNYAKGIDHKEFWTWCNKQVNEGHRIYVSEYEAPEDWTCIWSKTVNNSLTKNTGSKKGIERLFTKSP